mmetsp:Transcript_22696/g.38393  ORF Transcript_22696/g.38393 Transcript_22696/m.38393 type:complete len:496 (+) Transcript_22696:77-1564(+)|eukprot:CAMPEP_0114422372 /NCGR_PEP_ID=MMETSP0103-20121206/5573_1 /TAXON_ID=37642 ORGANISM="Paraphysomonas imperforata, Strain PA2" /NCGR_SAMPLE_ID=MMETSP0103 /ASSEMBLY_ACC=CAM_ASM_000201 /LENGTH=495 /DNA_ID=CAMNT_0001590949 /DNA_START=46 /DNA_END=1533 /DNA_ORIENTATION=-
MTELVTEIDEVLAAANALKDEGNTFLMEKKYSSAAQKYSEAIEMRPTAVFYSNRAMAMIKLESYGSAILDANEAISLDPTYIKGYYRRGSANFALGKVKEARKDFRTVCKLRPKDADAKKKLAACEKAVKAELFLAAIESEQTAPLSQKINLDEMEVESSYDGPHLEYSESADGVETVVTVDFVMHMMERFKSQKSIHKKYMMQLLLAGVKYLSRQSTLQRISLPSVSSHITVCGDTHGQFFDLCNIFEQGGLPSPTNPYLFNGDFVDRGSFSLEVVATLLAFKLAMPDALFMLRGNHETKGMNKIYGFEGEVKHKFDDNVMALFTEVFHWLPLAAVIQDKVFVVHGGLSTANDGAVSLDEINSINRNREPPESGLMSDLLWSDPQPGPGKSPSRRGVGFSFGPDITANFLAHNDLSLLVRSHEVKDEGYVVEHDGKCITIFSAPNYCDQMGNKGAFIRFSEETNLEPMFTQFTAVSHPNIPPMHYASAMSQFGL